MKVLYFDRNNEVILYDPELQLTYSNGSYIGEFTKRTVMSVLIMSNVFTVLGEL